MKESVFPYADNLQIFSNPVGVLKGFLSFESKKALFDRFNRHSTMNEELIRTQKDCTVDEELEHFNKILKQHSERQSENVQIKQIDFPQPDVVGVIRDRNKVDNLQPIAIPEPDSLLDKLHDKKVNLVLVATSLDENDVVQKLKGNLDPKTFSMIPLSFDENNNAVNQFNSELELMPLKRESNTDYGIKPERPKSKNELRSKRTTAPQKDEKYWKRRTSNNDAARRSREAKRARFAWIQNRVNELEVENANLQKELEGLEQKVLEVEKKAD